MRINPVLDTYHMYYGQKRKAIAINTVSDLSTTTGEAAETEKLPYFPLQNNCVNFTILLLLLKSNPSTIMSFNMIKCTTKLTNVKSKFCKKKFRKQRSQQLHVNNKDRGQINATPQYKHTEFMCNMCPIRQNFQSRITLKQHTLTMHEE